MSASRSAKHANVRRYRERMRALGLRPIQIWVPDTRSPKFLAECRRQSLLVARDRSDRRITRELEQALHDIEDWKA